MGVLRKWTGADAIAGAAEANERATSAATQATAAANIKASQEQALEAARSQQQIAERNVAADAASAAVSLPLDTPDVQVKAPSTDSAAETSATKRKKFGTGVYSTGVGI